MSITNGNCEKKPPIRFVFNRFNDNLGSKHIIDNRKIIDVETILSKEINKHGYFTVVGLTFDSEDKTLYKVTIHNVDEYGNVLCSSLAEVIDEDYEQMNMKLVRSDEKYE